MALRGLQGANVTVFTDLDILELWQMDRSQTRCGKGSESIYEILEFGSITNEKKKECDLLGCNCSEGYRK